MQRGVAKGLKVPCLFMITEVSIPCQKTPEGRLVYGVYPRIPPQYTTACTSITRLELVTAASPQKVAKTVGAKHDFRHCWLLEWNANGCMTGKA